MHQNAFWLIWNKAGLGRGNEGRRRFGITSVVSRCALEGIWVVTSHDCLVTYPDNAERVSRIMEQALGSVGIRTTIKVTAFDLNVLAAR